VLLAQFVPAFESRLIYQENQRDHFLSLTTSKDQVSLFIYIKGLGLNKKIQKYILIRSDNRMEAHYIVKLNVSWDSPFSHRVNFPQDDSVHFLDHTKSGFVIIQKSKSDNYTKIYVTNDIFHLDLEQLEPRFYFDKKEIVADVDVLDDHIIAHFKIGGQTKLRCYSLAGESYDSIELPEDFVSVLPSENQVHILSLLQSLI
jgi:protease II